MPIQWFIRSRNRRRSLSSFRRSHTENRKMQSGGIMNRSGRLSLSALALVVIASFFIAVLRPDPALADEASSTPKMTEKSFKASNDLQISVRMIAPYAAQFDLQIICVFQHKASGDK